MGIGEMDIPSGTSAVTVKRISGQSSGAQGVVVAAPEKPHVTRPKSWMVNSVGRLSNLKRTLGGAGTLPVGLETMNMDDPPI